MIYRLRNSVFWPFFWNIRKEQKKFERMLWDVAHCQNLNEKLLKAEECAYYAAYHPSGYYSSEVLENVYLEAAKELPSVVCRPIQNTVLHVMTAAYPSGGHTRVVERWINHSNPDEKHSIVVLSQDEEIIPEWIKCAPRNHGGEFIEFGKMNIMTRAEKLRILAAGYEKIVLHTHMHDGTAIIAFGVESFTNPVILFNHADHVFWLGVSVADIVADFQYGDFSTKRRLATKSFFLGIPPSLSIDLPKITYSKENLREEMGIPQDDFVVVSTGTEYKFHPLQSISFIDESLKMAQDGIRVYVIGPQSTERWKTVQHKSNGRVKALGPIYDKSVYYGYLLAADLYVGSFPFMGGTAMLDAVECGLPFVQFIIGSQESENNGIDSNRDTSPCWVRSISSLHETIKSAKSDEIIKKNLYENAKKWSDEYGNVFAWQSRLHQLYDSCPKKHSIHPFVNEKGKSIVIDDTVAFCAMQLCYNSIRIKNIIGRKIAYYWIKYKVS